MKKDSFPLVTAYISNYNYAHYLERAIQSILNQTFQDFELIIIDDGSYDGSLEIIKRYEAQERMFAVFQQNKGLNASNNVALKLARGKYIMRLDADDYLDPHALEVMVSTLERSPQLALVFPDYYLVDEQGNIIEQMRRHNFEKEVSLFDQPAHGACTMIRKDVLLSIGGYDETFSRQDGYDLWLTIINDYPVKNINLPLFYYRQHEKSLTSNEEHLFKTRAKIKEKHVQKRGLKPLSVLAIVPIRGSQVDSRSRPLALLGDKCVIDWTLEAALASQNLTKLLVTTPELKVQNYVREKYSERVMVVERKLELARINIPIEETIIHALNSYILKHKNPDALLILYIEAPFRTAMYIDKAIHTMQLYDADIVDGVRLDDNLFYIHNGQGLQPWKKTRGLRLERDELFRRVGGLHLIRRDFFEQERKILSGRISHVLFDQKAAFSIRSELDWEIAQYLAQQEK